MHECRSNLQRKIIDEIQSSRISRRFRSVRDGTLNAFERLSRLEGWLLDAALPGPGGRVMNLVVWLPAMFALGLTVMGLCYGFLVGCEKI